MMKTLIPLFSLAVLRGRSIAIILLMLYTGCKYKEPQFTVSGNAILTKDLKVNVEILKHDSTLIATTYYNGQSYEIENDGTLRYVIYISYKDSLFYKCEFDNLHGEMKGKPINEIIIIKKDGSIWSLYKPLEESSDIDYNALQPWSIFVEKIQHKDIEKEKFTTFYRSKITQ
ncbi:hypothetical protein [Pedobacter sp. N23S346]|uniref:hypothetical protein n=1 Tax=Pedobacter sp. N23S346 TaxID=3402750 RepID=UPI003ABFCA3A